MSILQIPLRTRPSQRVQVQLTATNAAGIVVVQNCVLQLRQLGGRQFFSLSLNGTPICDNVLMQQGTPLVLAAYTGFIGDFAVVDLSGQQQPPQYTGWGTRWVLLYNPNAGVPTGGV